MCLHYPGYPHESSVSKISKGSLSKFDLYALLKELDYRGYPLDDIFFMGSLTRSSSEALCSDILFSPDLSSAFLTLNLGLLTGSSPLPNYYNKMIEKGEIDEESFVAFLQFFNHHLVKDFLRLTLAENFLVTVQSNFSPHHRYEPVNWKQIQIGHLMMLGLDSICSLHWVFSLCFPELELNTQKCTRSRRVNSPDFFLGISQLDDKYALGGYIAQRVSAYHISLTSDVEQTDNHEFWPTEIRKRLKEQIFPILSKCLIYLNVYFTINQYNRATYLNKQSKMGYTSLGETNSNFTWLLYEGYGN